MRFNHVPLDLDRICKGADGASSPSWGKEANHPQCLNTAAGEGQLGGIVVSSWSFIYWWLSVCCCIMLYQKATRFTMIQWGVGASWNEAKQWKIPSNTKHIHIDPSLAKSVCQKTCGADSCDAEVTKGLRVKVKRVKVFFWGFKILSAARWFRQKCN